MLKKQTRISRRGRKPPKPALKPRRKPLQARAGETFSVVLEAAAQILERQGLEAFNTNAIAERAGVSIGSLYQYFPGKEAILAALHERYEEELLAAVSEEIAKSRSKPLFVCLEKMLDAQMAAHTRSPNLHRILEAEEPRISTEDGSVTAKSLQKEIAGVLRQHGVRSAMTAADDLLIITRAMIDTALQESSGRIPRARRRRILRALRGYLMAA